MHFVDIVPSLDLEIKRLQAARDLLASFTIAFHVPAQAAATSETPKGTEQTRIAKLASGVAGKVVNQALRDRVSEAGTVDAAPPEPITPPSAPAMVAQQIPLILSTADVTVKRLRPHHPREGRRTTKKQVMVQESALRGPVPAGPVVVSPEAVRKEQAWKSQPAPAEEIKIPVWSGPSSESRDEARSLDAMLQRLMDMGSSDEASREQQLPLPAWRHG